MKIQELKILDQILIEAQAVNVTVYEKHLILYNLILCPLLIARYNLLCGTFWAVACFKTFTLFVGSVLYTLITEGSFSKGAGGIK